MEILYRDEHVVVCIKPSGMLSEGDGDGCLPYELKKQLSGEDIAIEVFPVHRLDKETSGLMIYALNKEAAATLSADIREGRVEKEYLALCHGTPEKASDLLTDFLFYDRGKGKSFVVQRQRKGVKKAVLEYEVLENRGSMSLLHIKLHTGRTHQIRVQLSSRGHPLAGDRRYGAPKDGYGALALLSFRISFHHPVTGRRVTFTSKEYL